MCLGWQAQKANYDSTKQKAYALKETAKRARKEARMYRLKERLPSAFFLSPLLAIAFSDVQPSCW